MTPNIDVRNAALSYSQKIIFADIDLYLPKNTWIALLGTSGIGKSSLLRMLAGLPIQGKITGEMIADNGLPVHEQIAYMAQTDLLLPWLNVLDNILLSVKLNKKNNMRKKDFTDKAHVLLEQVGLNTAKKLYPHQLSGGMRQRVALIRTLIQSKPIILMDEPFSALDTITRYHLQNIAVDLLQHKTVLFITHDPTEALRLAHDIYIMRGAPANLQHVAHLTSARPRHLNTPDTLALQTQLFNDLLATSTAA